jgi:hypothetical protein
MIWKKSIIWITRRGFTVRYSLRWNPVSTISSLFSKPSGPTRTAFIPTIPDATKLRAAVKCSLRQLSRWLPNLVNPVNPVKIPCLSSPQKFR